MSYPRYHRQRKNRSVHGTDQSCDPGWKADHPSDPGDLPYLADSHAFYLRFGDRVSVLIPGCPQESALTSMNGPEPGILILS